MKIGTTDNINKQTSIITLHQWKDIDVKFHEQDRSYLKLD